MGMKLRDILSEIASDLKAKNYDDRISFRYIYSKFRSKLDYFLRLESKSREFLRDYTLWKKIDCFELEEVSPNYCHLGDVCKTVMKSKKKIPSLADTAYGKLIKVFSVDSSKEYTFIKNMDYKDYINRKFTVNKNVFWVNDNHIIIPDSIIDTITIYVIPKDESEISDDPCASPLDNTLNYPDYLISLSKQETIKELLGGYLRVVEDERGNDNTNVKN